MIDTKAIREKILDLAMRGKLVPQVPNDEPASELLKRIKAEKEELIKQKKIKRDKNETEIFRGDDGLHYEKFADGTVKEIEVPHELPESWQWANIGTVSLISSFESVKGKNIPLGAWVVELEDIQKETGILLKKRTKKNDDDFKSNKYHFRANTVLYGKLRPYLQKVIMVDENGYSTTEIFPIELTSSYVPKFLYHVLFSKRVVETINTSTYGVNLPRVNLTFFKSVLIPVPPLSEQKMIVEEIEERFGLVANIEIEQQSLQQLATQLKQKVLDVAMQGKLVPQDPNDEPASVLLEKIRAEKRRLFEEGKLKKKDLVESEIVKGDDNAYYENIPEGWLIQSLSAVGKTQTGNTPAKSHPDYYDGKFSFFKPSDLSQGIDLRAPSETLTSLGFEKSRHLPKGSVLVNSIGNIGNVALLSVDGSFNQQINGIHPHEFMDSHFLFWLLQSKPIQNQMIEKASATTIAIMNKSRFDAILIAFPSLRSQKNIASFIGKTFLILNQLQ